jgi:hypothetical protein
MASKYKRQSTGGRFKQRGAGDLGSGAIKTQADIVIDSLKLQQRRTSEYASDYLQGMKGVEQTEQWNQELLSSLEDKTYQAKRDAIKVRQKREVEALEGKAKEYGKEKEFWKDFSTTYSKQWGKLAQGATDLGQRIQADKQLEDFYASEKWQNLTDIENPIYKETTRAILGNKGDPEAQKAIVSMVTRLNRFARVDVLQEMKKQIPALVKNLESELEKKGIPWNKDTILAHVKTLSNQIQHQYGLARTREGKAFDKQMSIHAALLTTKSINLTKAHKETQELNASIKNIHSVFKNIDDIYSVDGPLTLKEIERRKKLKKGLIDITLLKAYTLTKHSWRTDKNGDVIKGLGQVDPKQIIEAMAEEYSLYDPSFDGIREMIGSIPDPDNPDVNMDMRYKGDKGKKILDQIAYDVSQKRSKESTKKKNELKAQKKNNLEAKLIITLKGDINSVEGGKALRQLEFETKGFPDLNNQVNAALAFRYNEHNLNSLYASLNRAIKNGDIEHIESIIGYLPEPQKTFYLEAGEKAKRFYSIFSKEILNGKAKAVTGKVQASALEISKSSLAEAHQLYKQQLMNYSVDYMTKNPKAQDTDILDYATQKAEEELNAGAGVWRIITDPSGKGTFAAFVQDEIEWVNGKGRHNPLYSGLWRNDRLKREMGVPSNEFEQKLLEHGLEGLLNHKDHGVKWNLVNIDDVDRWLKKTIRGETINTHPAVEALYKSQLRPGYSGEFYSRTQIMNMIAQKATSKRTEEYSTPSFRGSEGSTKVTPTKPRTVMKESELKDQDFYIVPLGSLDKADHSINTSIVNIPNYYQYSASDQTNLGALLWTMGKDGKFPKSKALDNLFSKATELGIPPIELVDGDPNIINYDYFTNRFITTTVRPR